LGKGGISGNPEIGISGIAITREMQYVFSIFKWHHKLSVAIYLNVQYAKRRCCLSYEISRSLQFCHADHLKALDLPESIQDAFVRVSVMNGSEWGNERLSIHLDSRPSV
jgi:hypothetical protein